MEDSTGLFELGQLELFLRALSLIRVKLILGY
jgi:hypothetical protein